MKNFIILALILSVSVCFGQKKESKSETTIACAPCPGIDIPLQKHIPLSKGEALTIKQHNEDVKANGPAIKAFLKRDSVFNRSFLPNTIVPHLAPGDTIENYTINETEIILNLKKPKKK